MILTTPTGPEQHAAAIVQLQTCIEDIDTRLADVEAFEASLKRWRERAVWAAAMATLVLANTEQEKTVDLIVKLLAALLGG